MSQDDELTRHVARALLHQWLADEREMNGGNLARAAIRAMKELPECHGEYDLLAHPKPDDRLSIALEALRAIPSLKYPAAKDRVAVEAVRKVEGL